MTLGQIRDLLACDVICGHDLMDTEVGECFAADLMSDVLAFSRPGAVLITGLASIQSVHTADVADLKAIIFVHGKRPSEPVVELARQQGIPLLTTGRVMFEACGQLFSHGLKPAARQ